jgi:hypothetical protein
VPDCYPHSPVPADSDLWPGELPFTAFGQHGIDALDKRVFEQEIWWVDRFGLAHLVTEMSFAYCRNVIYHLEDNVSYFHLEAVLRSVATMLGDRLLGRDTIEADLYEIGFGGIDQLTPTQWLEATSLMRRLRTLTQIAPTDPRPPPPQ